MLIIYDIVKNVKYGNLGRDGLIMIKN